MASYDDKPEAKPELFDSSDGGLTIETTVYAAAPAAPPCRPVRTGARALLAYARPADGALLAAALATTAAGAVCPAALTIVLGRIITQFSNSAVAGAAGVRYDIEGRTRPYIYAVVAIGAVAWATWTGVYFLWTWFAERQTANARRQVFDTLVENDFTYYDGLDSAGALMSRTQKELDDFYEGTSHQLGLALFHVASAVIGMGIGMYYSWQLTLVILASLPVLVVVGGATGGPLNKHIDDQNAENLAAAAVVDTAVSAVQTVKLMNGQACERGRFERAVGRATRFAGRAATMLALQQALCKFFVLVMFCQGFWFGKHLVNTGRLSSGEVTTVFFACNFLAQSVQAIAPQVMTIQKGVVAAVALQKITAAPQVHRPAKGVTLQAVQGRITFADVSFAYPQRPQRLVLDRADFAVAAGATTFVVGGSGSGKSTVGSLLLGLYPVADGQILVDGVGIQHLSTRWLRQHVTVVQQDSVLFNESIAQNIALGGLVPDRVTAADIGHAARLALLEASIRDFEHGVDTVVGKGGKNLSGGQRQRVAIARAIVRDSPVLVLDESTSALDIISRGLVLDAVRLWRQGRTTVIITHDLSQIDAGDSVVVLDAGRVVQAGTRAALERWPAGPFCTLKAHLLDGFDPSLDWTVALDHHDDAELRTAVLGTVVADAPVLKELGALARPPSARLSLRHVSFYGLDSAYWGRASQASLLDPRDSLSRPLSMARLVDAENMRAVERWGDVAHSRVRRRAWAARMSLMGDEGVLAFASSRYARRLADAGGPPAAGEPGLLAFARLCWGTVQCRRLVVLGLVAALLNGLSLPAFSYTFSRLIYSTFTSETGTSSAGVLWPVLVIVISVVESVATFFNIKVLSAAGDRWVEGLRRTAFARVLVQDYTWFNTAAEADAGADADAGPVPAPAAARTAEALTNTIMNDSDEMPALVSKFLGNILIAAVMVVCALVWALFTSWQVTLVAVAVSPVVFGASKLFAFTSELWERRCRALTVAANEVAHEAITNIRTVKVLALEPHFRERYRERVRACGRAGRRKGLFQGLACGGTEIAVKAVFAVLFYYGAVLVGRGSYSVDAVITAFTLIIFSTVNASLVVSFLPEIAKTRRAAVRMIELTRLPQSTAELVGDSRAPVAGAIELAGVHYSYPSRIDTPVLKDVSLAIGAGEVVAIVGASGSGKSTVVGVLTRLLVPEYGSVTLDGRLLAAYDVDWLRQNVVVVPQNPTLFNTTVARNIAYGAADVAQADVEAAAAQASVHDFVASLPDGYETVLGGSTLLSGGQAQRIAIARALVRRPRVLLLDECTSALDPVAAEQVAATVAAIAASAACTVVIVTHKRDMMEFADRVVVMDRGAVVETGAFAELAGRRNGFFSTLINNGQWA
ncbi:P-loop containing nucleoside triphosphate hydrolase protein [Dipodascopsis tothii]|uniref:P-loop containing nucleoside triphosphate hydrolase protein n=1 Tax=Dipodascopsis tothii TaxID=44089 RepID=UPI0034CEE0A4